MSSSVSLGELAEHWAGAQAAERANFQPYLIELYTYMGPAARVRRR
jgi:hypothetical protein